MKPLIIGNQVFPSNLIQGPLAGISASPFRALFYQFTPPAYCTTEMISAYEIVHQRDKLNRYLHRAPSEQKLCYQLSVNSADIGGQAAKIISDMGADLIDLNCGCPQKKIRQKGSGSKHLEQPEKLFEIISAMKANSACPLTVKIRLIAGGTETDNVNLAVGIQNAGADALIVHGRTHQQDYDVPVNIDMVAGIKARLNIPVIYNGDVVCRQSYLQAIDRTGADGVMCARVGSGKPWIYHQINHPDWDSTVDLQRQLFDAHLKALQQLESEMAVMLQSKRLVKYYFRDWLSEDWITAYQRSNDRAEQKELMTRLKGIA